VATIHVYVRTHVSGDQAAIDEIAATAAHLKTLIAAAGGNGCDFSVVPDVAPAAEAPAEPAPSAEGDDAVS